MRRCVLIVMAVFRPDPAHLGDQLRSLAAQSHDRHHLIAVIADTRSGELVEQLGREAGLTLTTVPSSIELDAVRAFEAGLAEALRLIDAPPGAAAGTIGPDPLIALCDQDDIWHRDRLQRGIAALADGGADLVHSDARLVAEDGRTVLHDSMFAHERRQRHPGLRGLLYRNNITGMTTLMQPRLARLALPFPPQSGVHFYHDLWLGLLAASLGRVHLIEAPLVDYRQHDANAIGAVDRRTRPERRQRPRLPLPMWLRREAAAYALARFLAHSTHNRLAEAVEDGRLPSGAARPRPLHPFLRRLRGAGTHVYDACRLAVTGHPGLARIAGGFAVVCIGRTVWALREALGTGLGDSIDSFDSRLYSLSPGTRPIPPRRTRQRPLRPVASRTLTDTRKEPGWTPDFTAAEPALTVLVPTLNPTEIFAGIVTALDIGLGIAARGHHVRFVATDLPVSSPGTSLNFLRRRLSAEAAAGGTAGRVSLHCGISSDTLPAHRDDRFMATAWWSAHVAERLIRRHGFAQRRFFYLIQDYEPNFYAWGPEYADAQASYGFDFTPIFNTTLLRDYFAERGYGFAGPGALAFHPSIDIARYAAAPHRGRPGGPRRLALYGRPEVPRNMYATAIETLARFLSREGLGPREVELVSIGMQHAPVEMPGGLVLDSLGKLPWEDYPDYLRSVDAGLTLMYSPHPSHLPLEMAAAGVQVVTNSFGPKDLSRLSGAIRSAPATAPALAEALSAAWRAGAVPDHDRWIDLTALGLSPERMIDRLVGELAGIGGRGAVSRTG